VALYLPDPERIGRRRFPDNKGFRKDIHVSSTDILSQLQDLLPSNYPKDNSTNLSKFYRVVAREIARIRSSNEAIHNDSLYISTRPQYLYQVLGERLFLGSKIAPTGYNDETYRRYLLSIKDAFLKGSKKINIEELASAFTGQVVKLRELYLDARYPTSSVDITQTHKMVVDVFINDTLSSGNNLGSLQNNLDFFINLTKPAHVLYDTRLIWAEQFDINKTTGVIFGDTGGGCVPIYDFLEFDQPTLNARQVLVLPSAEGANGQIEAVHYDDYIFYLQNSTRVLCVRGQTGTTFYDASGHPIPFSQLQVGQYVRISSVEIPGEFQFHWLPDNLFGFWPEQFYPSVYQLPAFLRK
jgi:hypothetical protein